ncbi:MAG TPA: hypothetical protein VJJ83_05230, partial [Candidatus Babeliales bacterium]|nr:hypothetical protein [Candidatus Babeliales bacterium]
MSQVMRMHRIFLASLVLLLLSGTGANAAHYVPKSVKTLATRALAAIGYGASCYNYAKTENDANHTAARTSQGIPVAKSAIAPVAISLAKTTIIPLAPVTKETSASVSSAKLTAIPAAKPAIPDFDQTKFQKVREKWQRRLENEERRLRIRSDLSAEDLDPEQPKNRTRLATFKNIISDKYLSEQIHR